MCSLITFSCFYLQEKNKNSSCFFFVAAMGGQRERVISYSRKFHKPGVVPRVLSNLEGTTFALGELDV